MRLALVSAGAALAITLVVAVVAVINWHEVALVKPNGAPPIAVLKNATLTSASTSSVVGSSVEASVLKGLVGRCKLAMTKDICGIMKSSSPGSSGNSPARLFIAGVGEVDSNAFARLRDAGDQMCSEVETECRVNWSGPSCKLARALYPL